MSTYRATTPLSSAKDTQPSDFARKHALSASTQPMLVELFRDVRDERTPLTFIVGAGSSINAGFPSWRDLVRFIAGRIEDANIRAMAIRDDSDPMRKAEFLISLAQRSHPQSQEEIIRDALYDDRGQLRAGNVASAIAGLVIESLTLHPNRLIRVATTNFDDVLEIALADYRSPTGRVGAKAQSIDLRAPLKTNTADDVQVLHLHGMLSKRLGGNLTLRPVILSEADFLKHGPDVRAAIQKMLKEGIVVFVGMSMTDPNTVGPLFDSRPGKGKERKHRAYVLIVSDESGEASLELAREFSVHKATYLRTTLSATPIFLKSYGQLIQLLQELNLALNDSAYDIADNHPTSSVAYGPRFSRILNRAYDALSIPSGKSLPSFEGELELSDRLASIIGRDSDFRAVLARLIDKLNLPRALRSERFGLELWLRRRGRDGSHVAYDLIRVGSSDVVERQRQLELRRISVDSSPDHLVSKAYYEGEIWIENVREPGSSWRGSLVVPIRAGETGNGDQVVLGMANLLTERLARARRPQQEAQSVLGYLATDGRESLALIASVIERDISKLLT